MSPSRERSFGLRFESDSEANIIATLLRRCRRAVTVDHRDVKEIRTMKRQHGSLEDRIETAIRLPPAESGPDAGVMDLLASIHVFFYG